MKVLVSGEKSYAGSQFANRINKLNKGWQIDFVSVRDNDWDQKDFSLYDAIYHVAGIVHTKETVENKDIFYKVNRDLTYQFALKAKNEGVKSFVFLSTMAVYGLIGKIGEDTIISKETEPDPTSNYGKSKLEAEELLKELQSSCFNISILRIPMIYGPNCPGNYSSLSKLARKIPVFPKIDNKRSMIFVDYLSDIVTHIIERKLFGVFLVKNPVDVNTINMVSVIREYHGKRIYKSSVLGYILITLGNYFATFRKMFGSIYYKNEDCVVSSFKHEEMSFKETIFLSEKE